MAKNLIVGESVCIPCSQFEEDECGSALYRTTVQQVINKSVVVTSANGNNITISSSLVHRNLGIWIVVIGDYETEDRLLKPLGKSVLQYCLMLHDDDSEVRIDYIRTVEELSWLWNTHINAYQFFTLIAHGSNTAFRFGHTWVNAADLVPVFAQNCLSPKVFVSLCCETGKNPMGSILSRQTFCDYFIAPFHSIHGAVASQFYQTFLAYVFIQGMQIKSAFNNARKNVPCGSKFRVWRDGRLLKN